jgi:hypothetical protein
MDENPYKSPESVSEVERQTAKAPTKLVKRHAKVAFYGNMACWGLFFFQMVIFEISRTLGVGERFRYNWAWLVLCAFLIHALLVGAAIAFWAWRNPKSKWPVVAATVLGCSPFLLCAIFALFVLIRLG